MSDSKRNALVNDFIGVHPDQQVDIDRLWDFIERCPVIQNGNRRYMPVDIISIRFASDGSVAMSHGQMAQALGVSKVRARQLLEKARRDLLHPLNRDGLESAYIMTIHIWRVSFRLNESPINRWSEIWSVDGIVSFAKIESIAHEYLREQYNDDDPHYAEIESIERLGAVMRGVVTIDKE